MGIIFGVIVVMSAACWFIMKNMEKGNRRFVAIAVVEHIIFTLVLALAIYTKPASAPIDTPMKVTIEIIPRQKEKPELEIPVSMPPIRQVEPSHELPSIHSTNIQDYLESTQSTGGLPDLPNTRASIQNPNRLSLGAISPRGHHQTDGQDELDALVRAKPITPQEGYTSHSERRGLPNSDARKPLIGERGQHLTGRLAPGRLSDAQTNRITKGTPGINIGGEVKGRNYRLPGELQEKGQGGVVKLSFKVRPDGTVFNVQPRPGTTVGEVRLKEKAIQYVKKMRFSSLPRNVRQVVQSGTITINFTVKVK